MSSASDPVTDFKSPHCIWFRDITESDNIRVYLDHLTAKYCQNDMAVLGPNIWFISEASYYKATTGTQHECFVATLRLNPRLFQQSLSPGTSNSQLIYLTLERDKDSGMDAGSDNLPSEAKIKSSISKHQASDTASLSRSLKDEDYKLLFSIKLPPPSSGLVHGEDIDTVFKELTNTRNQLPGHMDPERHFISLPILISLANSISQARKQYEATSSNCYWYSSMIFFCLRTFTSSEIIFADGQKILPGDSVDLIKERFRIASINRGHFGMVELVNILNDQVVAETLSTWKPRQELIENEIRRCRLAHISTRRDEQEKMRKMDEKMRRMDDEMRKKDDERKKAEYTLRCQGWSDEKIEELFKC